ncbi:MAG: hypothetical protein Q4B84_04300, partial [Clostridia bacterium]|nr:hypothetical protein [Clostridia bacterium]
YTFNSEQINDNGEEIDFNDNLYTFNSQQANDNEEEPNTISYYEMSNVKSNGTVFSDVSKLTPSITFLKKDLGNTKENSIEYKIISPAYYKKIEEKEEEYFINVNSGTSLSFMVKAKEGYDISDIIVHYIRNNNQQETLRVVNNVYTLENITQDIIIEVENVKKLKNKATFSKYEGIIFKYESGYPIYNDYVECDYGKDVNFTVARDSGYITSNITINAEFADGQTFSKTIDKDGKIKGSETGNDRFLYRNGTFTIKELKQNVRIYITGTEIDKYNIGFSDNESVEFRDQYGEKFSGESVGVSHGESFSFRIFAKNGFDLSNMKVYKNFSSQKARLEILPVNDIYKIENINENLNITVENISKVKYNIEFRTTNGVRCIDPNSGKDIGEDVSVEHGSNFKFKLLLDKAYSDANPKVAVKGAQVPLVKNDDGVYTVEKITDDKIIEILDVKKNSYTVTFKKTEGLVYKTSKNKVFEGTQEIEYDGKFYFKISVLDAYDESLPWVLLNNEKTLTENSGLYCLENITSNSTVIVKNVVKNKEEVSMDSINNVPQEVNSESDVNAVVDATLKYDSLSDEEKEKVTNLESLKASQDLAGEINHKFDGIEVSGIDWNAKVYVTPLNDNLEQMQSFDKKIDRRTVLSLYEIKLVDVLTGEEYEVEYGKTVSVAIPSVDLVGYKNIVVVHEKKSGSIEYLDADINSDFIKFETASFSKFAVAAKEIPNYSEGTSDLQISVSELIEDNNELTTLLGNDVSSKLGSII